MAGLRSDGTQLPGRPPTYAELRAAFVDKAKAHRDGEPLPGHQ